jgi:hypothetical protein
MEQNDEKELEGFLSSEPEPRDEEEKEEVEEREPEPEEEAEEEPSEEEGEEVEALTERETALIAQFTESIDSGEEIFDPSKLPETGWNTQEYHFLKEGESLDDLLADPSKFNAKMAQFYNDALQRGAQLALEATYRNLPRTVSTYAKQQIDTVNLVNDFYQQNKDLIPLKPALARIAQKVGTEHPEYTLPQLLAESAKAARTIFKMKKEPPKKVSKTPAFVQQKGGTNRVQNSRNTGTKSLEDEIMDLIR